MSAACWRVFVWPPVGDLAGLARLGRALAWP